MKLRRCRFVLGTSLLLTGILLLGVRLYLTTSSAARGAAGRLGILLKAPVTIAGVNGKIFGTSTLYEPAVYDPDEDGPLLVARRIDADLSVWKVLLGARLPRRIEVFDARMRLRFNADGKLLTKMPELNFTGTPPAITFHNATVTVLREGREPLTISNISARMVSEDKDNITGEFDDPLWGRFAMSGHYAQGELTIHAESSSAQIDLPRLRSVPFVPLSLWERIQAEAETAYLRVSLILKKTEPRKRYRLEFGNLRIRLPQADRPAPTVFPVSGVLDGNPDGFNMSVEAKDPYWGDWSGRVQMDAERTVAIELRGKDIAVDGKKLEALPYAPKGVWQQVRATGRTSARLALVLTPDRPVQYRIEAQPQKASVYISSLDLTVQDTCGDFIVEDAQVWVNKATGKTAGGNLALSSNMDFRGRHAAMNFDVGVFGLGVRQLPSRLGLPDQLEGKVTGKAQLEVSVGDSGIQTHGSGSGRISEAKLFGFAVTEPIQLTLRADHSRFRFLPRSPLLRALLSTGPAWPTMYSPGDIRPEKTEATMLDVALPATEIDLAQAIRAARIETPVPVAGRLSAAATLSLPINNTGDLSAYHVEGALSASQLKISGVSIEELSTPLLFSRGRLQLDRLKGRLSGPSGRFLAGVDAQLAPRGDLTFDLDMEDLPLQSLLGTESSGAKGTLSGQVRGSVPLAQRSDPASWRGQARLQGRSLEVGGVPLGELLASLNVEQGRAHLSELRGGIAGGKLGGSATLTLREGFDYLAQLTVSGVDLASLQAKSPVSVSGSIDTSVKFAGRLSDARTLTGNGTVRARGIRVGPVTLPSVDAELLVARDRLTLRDIRCPFHGGEISGVAALVLTNQQIDIDLQLANLAVESLRGLVREYLPAEVRVQGRLSGQLSATVRTQGVSGLEAVAGHLHLDLPDLSVQGVPVQKLSGKLDCQQGKIRYLVQGEALGAKLLLDGKYPPPPIGPVSQPHGWLRLERLSLQRIWPILGFRDNEVPLTGLIGVSLPFRHDGPKGSPVGHGRFEFRDLRWNDVEMAEVVRGDLRLGSDSVSVRDVSGIVAGGLARLNAMYRFGAQGRGWFDLSLNHVDIGRFLKSDAESRPAVQGGVDVTLRGKLGSECRGNGSVVLARGKVMGVEVSDVRLPLDVTFAPWLKQAELSIHEGGAQLGQGRATVRASLRWGDGLRLEGRLRLVEATLQSLAGLVGDVSGYARGRVSGVIDFGAANLRSLTDLNATVQATMRSAEAFKLPVLQQLVPYLVPGQGAVEFTQGELKGQLSTGVLRLSEMTLESPLVQLFIQGSVGVQGRFDLDVTAHTSKPAVNPIVLQLLLKGVPVAGPIPLGVLLQINSFFSDRVVQLRVSGSAKSPRVSVEPIRLLSDQAARFFLSQAVRAGQ